MDRVKIIPKFIYLFIVMIIQIKIGLAADQYLEETKPLIKSVQSSNDYTLKKEDLRKQILLHLESFDLLETKSQHKSHFQKISYAYGQKLDVGLLAIINLSSSNFQVLHYGVKSRTVCIFPRGYANKDTESISFLMKNTKFIKLLRCQDKNGEDLYSLSSETISPYSANSCNVIVFGEYNKEDRLSVIEGILERYKRYSQKEEKHLLEGRVNTEPELSSYLNDPESFSTSLKRANLIFFYEETLLISV